MPPQDPYAAIARPMNGALPPGATLVSDPFASIAQPLPPSTQKGSDPFAQIATPIDYDALAAQHGGWSTAPAVDYDALAAQHGGTATDPYADIAVPIRNHPTGGTVTLFAPDGTLGDVPMAQMRAALKAGAKPAITVKAPDGSIGQIPANRLQDAVKAGASVVPFEQQENQHPGFWHALWSDLSDMAKGVTHLNDYDPMTDPKLSQDQKMKLVNQDFAEADAEDARRKAAGYGPIYRNVTAPAAGMMGVNVPGMEQSAAEGDAGGVMGHAAAVPSVMAATSLLPTVAGAVADTGTAAVRGTVKGVNTVLAKAPGSVGALAGGAIGHATGIPYGSEIGAAAGYGIGSEVLPKLQIPGENFGLPKPVYPGAPLPATPPPEVAMAKGLAQGSTTPPRPQAAALGDLPLPAVHQALQELGPQASIADLTDRANDIANGNTIPRTLSGESALRQVLGGQDNANLLKIAKSRGINVTQESQLKPGVANGRLINKIIDDMSPEELGNARDTYLENTRIGPHQFGDIGPEAWKTMSLQSYFPDVKIPAAILKRVQGAIGRTGVQNLAGDDSLLNALQESLKKVKAGNFAPSQR